MGTLELCRNIRIHGGWNRLFVCLLVVCLVGWLVVCLFGWLVGWFSENLKFCAMIESKYSSKATSLNLKITRDTACPTWTLLRYVRWPCWSSFASLASHFLFRVSLAGGMGAITRTWMWPLERYPVRSETRRGQPRWLSARRLPVWGGERCVGRVKQCETMWASWNKTQVVWVRG